MPHGCQKGKQPLTWEELRKLLDRTPICIEQFERPYACVLRWEIPQTLCVCAFDPGTGDDTHVLARFNEARFERKQPKIWKRVPTPDEIVAAQPMTDTQHGKWWDDV